MSGRDREKSIQQLSLHKENLAACDTFEQWKACHQAWMALMISEAEAEQAMENAAKRFLANTEFIVRHAMGKHADTTEMVWQEAPPDHPEATGITPDPQAT